MVVCSDSKDNVVLPVGIVKEKCGSAYAVVSGTKLGDLGGEIDKKTPRSTLLSWLVSSPSSLSSSMGSKLSALSSSSSSMMGSKFS